MTPIEAVDFISKKFNNLKNEKTRIFWNNYIKNEIDFLGVPLPTIRKIIKEMKQQNTQQDFELINLLFSKDYAEFKLAGICILENIVKTGKIDTKVLETVSGLFDSKYIFDWNTCDWLCVKVITPIVDKDNIHEINIILGWNNSKLLWKSGASVVPFAQSKNLNKYWTTIKPNLESSIQRIERFSKTSVGWVLRELSKNNLHEVVVFLKDNIKYLTIEVINNALKYHKTEKEQVLKEYKSLTTAST
jgi:3-methyladenine DNA glycosylase AlkD